jgi:hypothetical protein
MQCRHKGQENGFPQNLHTFNIPRSILLDYMKNADTEKWVSSSIARKCALGNEQETKVAKQS